MIGNINVKPYRPVRSKWSKAQREVEKEDSSVQAPEVNASENILTEEETAPEQLRETASTVQTENVGQSDEVVAPAVMVIGLTERGQIVEIADTEECFEFNGLHHDGYNYGVKNSDSKKMRLAFLSGLNVATYSIGMKMNLL